MDPIERLWQYYKQYSAQNEKSPMDRIPRDLSQPAIPTYSDTKGFGNVVPWQMSGGASLPQQPPQSDQIMQMLMKGYGPAKAKSFQEQMMLERLFTEAMQRKFMEFRNNLQPKYNVPVENWNNWNVDWNTRGKGSTVM